MEKLKIFYRYRYFAKLPYRYRYRYFPKSPYRYRYRYFWNYLIDIDIFQNCPIDIDIDIFNFSISISISIFDIHIDILTRRRSNKNVFYRCTRGRSNKMCFTGAKKCLFYHFFMECHSIQFTTISINVERGIVKILFKYRYFQDLLIDIDIDIDIFQNHHIDIDIDIDIFGIALSISIS